MLQHKEFQTNSLKETYRWDVWFGHVDAYQAYRTLFLEYFDAITTTNFEHYLSSLSYFAHVYEIKRLFSLAFHH
jgi:hypothetical protein